MEGWQHVIFVTRGCGVTLYEWSADLGKGVVALWYEVTGEPYQHTQGNEVLPEMGVQLAGVTHCYCCQMHTFQKNFFLVRMRAVKINHQCPEDQGIGEKAANTLALFFLSI